MRKLGVISGAGPTPRRVADASGSAGCAVFIIALKGITEPETVQGLDHAWVGLGHLQAMIDHLHAANVTHVVMAGPVRRPSLSGLDLDARAIKTLARAGWKSFGDDGALSAIVEQFEMDGFTVVGIDDVMADVLVPHGLIAGPEPDASALADIQRGLEVLRIMGPADIGQSAAVQGGVVLALEAVEGTDAMIRRAGTQKRAGPGPVLVKISKPGQERRVDLPTIGAETISTALVAGFRGLAAEAGEALLMEGDAVRKQASAAGFFVIGVTPPGKP